MRETVVTGVAAMLVGTAACVAEAYEFRARVVRRAGNVDYPLDGFQMGIHGPPYAPARVRVQFGVFDDEDGPAPEGGFVGWNVGFIESSNSLEYSLARSPGRLAPFNFAPNGNGSPAADPFVSLHGIDATLGIQSPFWPAGSDPDSPPLPVIRGRNQWVSVYEFTATPPQESYRITNVRIGGNMIAATEWRTVGTPVPPSEDEAGMIAYVPNPLTPVEFDFEFQVITFPIPAPAGAVALAGAACGLGARRRRVNRG